MLGGCRLWGSVGWGTGHVGGFGEALRRASEWRCEGSAWRGTGAAVFQALAWVRGQQGERGDLPVGRNGESGGGGTCSETTALVLSPRWGQSRDRAGTVWASPLHRWRRRGPLPECHLHQSPLQEETAAPGRRSLHVMLRLREPEGCFH